VTSGSANLRSHPSELQAQFVKAESERFELSCAHHAAVFETAALPIRQTLQFAAEVAGVEPAQAIARRLSTPLPYH
jgi:hypothetical protein